MQENVRKKENFLPYIMWKEDIKIKIISTYSKCRQKSTKKEKSRFN